MPKKKPTPSSNKMIKPRKRDSLGKEGARADQQMIDSLAKAIGAGKPIDEDTTSGS